MYEGILAAKLCELSSSCAQLKDRTDVCRNEDADGLKASIRQISEECAESEAALKNGALNGKNPGAAALSELYLEFSERLAETVKNISGKALFDELSPSEDDAERAMLFAEYAIDFAVYAARQATLAAMTAVYKEKRLSSAEDGRGKL
ncbi:MAG TPA: hypothetical protein H9900_00375 [Candidatus Monoglobus merdigallinarum]|uniref:Uncharacterized protein n=1 Tax=Candidatus Monoglobus merdigallinarum TaxID=2838698 RepID=A0A9D1TM04_9FIRM|nr:hypothetical protein [Candidatus Monoglobus merdigallinarum]